ncbi:type ISP restriction/modification enzyme [Mucilaginibacter sp. RCC_168]|uniref:type ISP restriction/modification enzyme n=1 Tax=Mucilaginibacter sp. RCC_168 TaxID=3239221 RepID=UPI0035262B3C
MIAFNNILNKYRTISFSQRDKGNRFERLMQAYLLTDPQYTPRLKNVWLWNEFHGKRDLGGVDTGIDLVAKTFDGDYWAIQCKCYAEGAIIDKPAVDSFLSTSSRQFKNEELKTVAFSHRLWIDTTGKRWGSNAEEAIKNQYPAVNRIKLHDLQQAPIEWEKLENGVHGEAARTRKYTLKSHQREAMEKTHEVFKAVDRGKLVMACGTGKTFNSLRIAENETDNKGFILFLVPSIALLGQTLREWTILADEPINAICICSDPAITKKQTKNEDSDGFSVVDLALPASTNVQEIIHQFNHFKLSGNPGMTVVFSTYQSIEVIAKAQTELLKEKSRFGEFDLIICDEAHRTTGVSLAGADESAFTKVHDNTFIKSKKRLYMTATPRLYSDDTKTKAAQADAVLCSMDDEALYGKEIYRIGFGEAVSLGLLTDYKVLILTLNENDVPPAVQKMIENGNNEINTDDASKLIGCVNALSKQILGDAGILEENDPEPMRRAVAFCQTIANSKKITETYNTASEVYIASLPGEKKDKMVSVASKHIDGTMSAPERDELLGWLKAEAAPNECRILTNVRCLSEGVDVPSLDAVMFLSARNSQVDVVQSVGRVMRLSPGKKYGYIIIPVVVPSTVKAEVALNDNERYKVVWTVLNALRAHDDRFNAIVNKIELNKARPEQILVGRPDITFEDGMPVFSDKDGDVAGNALGQQLAVKFEELQNIVFARMVQKVGDRLYWEQWAKDVAQIAERQVARITKLVKEDVIHQQGFDNFLSGLQKNINPSITSQEAIEMLSQHIITKPVFEALFEGYSFVSNNPISISMQTMIDLLETGSLEKDTETLQKFYDSVRKKASGIDNAEGKQRIIIELYDKFFKTAFPRMVEKLGIVYTPVEVVDFIIHSVNDVLKKEFGRSISDENIHILDPFTGTGTFVTRLIQSGLINKADLKRKYQHEIHANEIVLLAYYIAAVNIENAYHDAIDQIEYTAFDGICLTDTFQLGETDNNYKLHKDMFPQNSERVAKQKAAPLKVIMGNPPYSVGQKSANDNAQNQSYPKLDSRITATYAKESAATSVKDLYNSYIKAFRWASDRLDKEYGGIIAFITNSGWLEANDSDGFRKCLQEEFSTIYVFNLRGSIRGRSGDSARREGQNVFEIMTGVSITLAVKKPNSYEKAKIHYTDIGDYLNRKEKLNRIRKFAKVTNPEIEWQNLIPNEHNDWLNQRMGGFEFFIPLVPDKKFDQSSKSAFVINSLGANTNRDAWVYNSAKKNVIANVTQMIDFYNSHTTDFIKAREKKNDLKVAEFINNDPTKISWSSSLIPHFEKGNKIKFESNKLKIATYRLFHKRHLYFGEKLIHRRGQFDSLFPNEQSPNIVIVIPGLGERRGFSVTISENIVDLNIFDGGCQCLPLYYYEERQLQTPGLFDAVGESKYIRRDGISDYILNRARSIYGKIVTKEDIFYYIYGFLHSHQYRTQFANDLKKMLPRLQLVEDVRDFYKISRAGRELAELHINYESVAPYQDCLVTGEETDFFTVEKMRFQKKEQKDKIIYNSQISVSNIPDKAYQYIVNGKSAIEWIVERYQVVKHKESGISNDPNDWGAGNGNPRYILDLLLSIINVSVKTVDIVNSLPAVSFDIGENLVDTENNIYNLDESLNANENIAANPMKEFSLNEGIYFVNDVVQITKGRLKRDKVTRWFKELSKENYEGLSTGQQQDVNKMRISFYGLIELVVIGTLRDNKFALKKILTARTNLKNLTNKIYPFATNNVRDDLKVAGNSIKFTIGDNVVTLDGTSQLNLDIIKSFFSNISFDTSGLAQQFFPIENSKLIVVDPKQGGGKAVINNGTAVWAETIASVYDGLGSIDMLSIQYEITKEQILAAVEYLN